MRVAANGAEALDVLRGGACISLVILDLTMPVMTGEQALPDQGDVPGDPDYPVERFQ